MACPCPLSVSFGRQPDSFSRKPKVHWSFVTVTKTAVKLHYRSVSAPKPNSGRSLRLREETCEWTDQQPWSCCIHHWPSLSHCQTRSTYDWTRPPTPTPTPSHQSTQVSAATDRPEWRCASRPPCCTQMSTGQCDKLVTETITSHWPST